MRKAKLHLPTLSSQHKDNGFEEITTAMNTRELTKAFELRPGGGVVAAAVVEVALDDLLLRQNLVREALPQGEQHGLAPGALALAIGARADNDVAGHCHPTRSLFLFPTALLICDLVARRGHGNIFGA